MKLYVIVGLLVLVLVIAVTGCGSSSKTDPNADYKTALQAIDISDGGEGGQSLDQAVTPGQVKAEGLLNTFYGVTWSRCYFDNVSTSVQLLSVTNNTTSATGSVTYTVTGNYHAVIDDSNTSNIPLNNAFSVTGNGTVYFTKNANGHWQVSNFSSAPLKSDASLSPIIALKQTCSFTPVPPASPFLISLTNQNASPFVSSANVTCVTMPNGTTPVLLFIATRNFGIDWSTPYRRQFTDPATCTSTPYDYTCNPLPLRPNIAANAQGKAHFGGIFACELVNSGTAQAPTYGIYLTIYPGMILVTP